jgi:cytochrome c553
MVDLKKTESSRPCHIKALLLFVIILSALIFPPAIAAGAEESGSVSEGSDIRRGERFFKGLLPFNREHEACASCHNLDYIDTLNWNPSAYEIAVKYASQDFNAFRTVVMNPMAGKMAQVHENYVIEETDLRNVKAYLDNLATQGPPEARTTHFNLIFFIFLLLLVIWALVELLFMKKIKYRFIPGLIFLGALGWQAKMIVEEATRLGRQQYYAPNQPVKFSHKVHAGDQKIDCLYCHHTAEQSKSANIPPSSLCMNCHMIIREGTNSGRFEIAKVVNAFETGQRIEWTRIHNLPDHVFFSHAQHVNAGKLDCAECHGQVETMDKLMQVNDLSMGWCLDCHRTKEVQFTSNSFYETYEKMHEQLKKGEITKVTADMVGGEDCMKCHY